MCLLSMRSSNGGGRGTQLRIMSRGEIPFDGISTRPVRLVGRWFIMVQVDQRFVLYNTNSNAETRRVPQLLWEREKEIIEWDESSGALE